MSFEQIAVDNGKYIVLVGDGEHAGQMKALRNGETWNRDITGDNLVYWLAVELRNARQSLDQAAAERAANPFKEYWQAHQALLQAERAKTLAAEAKISGWVNPDNAAPTVSRTWLENRNAELQLAADSAYRLHDVAVRRYNAAATAAMAPVIGPDRKPGSLSPREGLETTHQASGHEVIEAALQKASKLDPSNSPFGMSSELGQAYQQGMAAAYQHALEMIPAGADQSPSVTDGWRSAAVQRGWLAALSDSYHADGAGDHTKAKLQEILTFLSASNGATELELTGEPVADEAVAPRQR